MIIIRDEDFIATVDDNNVITSNDSDLEQLIEPLINIQLYPSYQQSVHGFAAHNLKQIFDEVEVIEEYDEDAVY